MTRPRGTITGITHATTPAHLARATFEAIAHQVADVFQAIQAAGGASGNRFLMQLQADLAGCPARASRIEEVGAFRAAAMVMAALGGSKVFPTDSTELAGPGSSIATRQLASKAWERALRQAMDR
jgi:glycerol kinase